MRPYLLRYVGFWLDHEQELPYPMPEPGTSYEEFYENFMFQAELRGEDDASFVKVPADDINPYALGHLINHPPPDIPVNAKLLDFDLPYTFFPSTYARYIPYIVRREEVQQG